MRQPATALLLLVFSWTTLEMTLCGQSPPAGENSSQLTEEIDRGEEVKETFEELRGVVILRVSEAYLKRLFARDFDKRARVTRLVLGTRAQGISHTKGRADVNTEPDGDDAAFHVKITGTTTASTVGRNGTAVIYSRSTTQWTANKIVRFDGKQFTSKPASITSETHIQPLGAKSTLPGIRGMIVARVAARRAIELNSEAEHIIGQDTQRRIQRDVDRAVDQRIVQLNERVENQPLLAFLLPKLADAGVEFSTSSHCLNISFTGGVPSAQARVCPVGRLEPAETELWFQTDLIAPSMGKIPQMIDGAGAWITEQLPDIDIPGLGLPRQAGILPLDVEIVDGWVVLRSRRAESAKAQAIREAAHLPTEQSPTL